MARVKPMEAEVLPPWNPGLRASRPRRVLVPPSLPLAAPWCPCLVACSSTQDLARRKELRPLFCDSFSDPVQVGTNLSSQLPRGFASPSSSVSELSTVVWLCVSPSLVSTGFKKEGGLEIREGHWCWVSRKFSESCSSHPQQVAGLFGKEVYSTVTLLE